MKELAYQHKAVSRLVRRVIEALKKNKDRNVIVFKAPTGSGKTVMASEMLSRLVRELELGTEEIFPEVAFIWIAPNRLHEQSYLKMKDYFKETLELAPVVFDELDHSFNGYIKPGEILFVNWESINKANNTIVNESEQSASLFDITRRTQNEQGIPIVVIVDEEHMFGGRNAEKSEKVLRNINPKVELRVSATPLPESMKRAANNIVEVKRQEVIGEEMIKEGVLINPAIKFKAPVASLNLQMLSLALEKREELAQAYKDQGSNINPLLLIQLPNDGKSMSEEDTTIKEEVIDYLREEKGITTENYKLAIWLSNEKTENLKGIEKNDDLTEVLLFKQAIALGWDCPRAAILLIYRDIKSATFGAQTVGRILRMPEQKHYSDPRLNFGYVYTNLSTEYIEIENESLDLLTTFEAHRVENLQNVRLTSQYEERLASSRNRLGGDFKAILKKAFEKSWLVKTEAPMLFTLEEPEAEYEGEKSIPINTAEENVKKVTNTQNVNFKVSSIGVNVVRDVKVTGEVGYTVAKNETKYVKTFSELERMFHLFCQRQLQLSASITGVRYEKVSAATLSFALKEAMGDIFGIMDTDAIKVIMSTDNTFRNRAKFEKVIQDALKMYAVIVMKRQTLQKEKNFKDYIWEVPAERVYKEDTYSADPKMRHHALQLYYRSKRASDQERDFERFLESNSKYIDWWYKNGDSGKQHFAITYENQEKGISLFYMDYVIRMKNGQILLFDTKSEGSDGNAPEKHNAFIDYCEKPENKEKHLLGGIIIRQGDQWLFPEYRIKNTTDLSGWTSFFPDKYK